MISTVLSSVGTSQLLVIIVLALLLFGGKKIPELMKGLGTGLREFKKATQDDSKEEEISDKKSSIPHEKNTKDSMS